MSNGKFLTCVPVHTRNGCFNLEKKPDNTEEREITRSTGAVFNYCTTHISICKLYSIFSCPWDRFFLHIQYLVHLGPSLITAPHTSPSVNFIPSSLVLGTVSFCTFTIFFLGDAWVNGPEHQSFNQEVMRTWVQIPAEPVIKIVGSAL